MLKHQKDCTKWQRKSTYLFLVEFFFTQVWAPFLPSSKIHKVKYLHWSFGIFSQWGTLVLLTTVTLFLTVLDNLPLSWKRNNSCLSVFLSFVQVKAPFSYKSKLMIPLMASRANKYEMSWFLKSRFFIIYKLPLMPLTHMTKYLFYG
jgi:hypothetical protein